MILMPLQVSVLPTISPDQSPPHLAEVSDMQRRREGFGVTIRNCCNIDISTMMTIFTYASVLPTFPPNQSPPRLTEICDGGKERQGGVLLLTFDLHKVVVEQVLRIRRVV